jgi:hypothetical protein
MRLLIRPNDIRFAWTKQGYAKQGTRGLQKPGGDEQNRARGYACNNGATCPFRPSSHGFSGRFIGRRPAAIFGSGFINAGAFKKCVATHGSVARH